MIEIKESRCSSSARMLSIVLLFLLILQGCATATLWDHTESWTFLPLRHVGNVPGNNGILVVGYGTNDDDEQWFELHPGSPGPASFSRRLGDELRPMGNQVLFPTAASYIEVTKAHADRIKRPPLDVQWVSVQPYTAEVLTSQRYANGNDVYALSITDSTPLIDHAVVPTTSTIMTPSLGEMVLTIPRAPQGAQNAKVVTAALLTPFTVALDVVTFPISIPLGIWRSSQGP